MIRKVDPWSVFKVSVLFYLSMLAIVLVAGIVLWTVARSLGAIDNVENFIGDLFAVRNFRFDAGKVLRGASLGGLVFVGLGTGGNVLMAVLFNLITDVVGGVEVVTLDEEPAPSSVL